METVKKESIKKFKRMNIGKYVSTTFKMKMKKTIYEKTDNNLYMDIILDTDEKIYFYPILDENNRVVEYAFEFKGRIIKRISIVDAFILDPYLDNDTPATYLYKLRKVKKMVNSSNMMGLLDAFIKEANSILTNDTSEMEVFSVKSMEKVLINFRYSKN